MSETGIEIVEDSRALARHAAALVIAAVEATTGKVGVCLAGGATPWRLYRLLGSAAMSDRIPWRRVHWFWGDERFVPPDHADSNYRMIREAMLDESPAPPAHIHQIETVGLEPEQSAALYERNLKLWYGGDALDTEHPLFEVTLLGVGEDGHTASLFPGSRALDENVHWTSAVTDAMPEPRISLTLPALCSSRLVLFLVAGANKHPVWRRLRNGEDLPANRVRPSGKTLWLVDRAAHEGTVIKNDA
jgi:6-phosphogluconolactonase